MKKLLFIILLLPVWTTVTFAGEECFKSAPDPIYTEEKGYGYTTDVPCDNDEYPHSIMKTWQNGATRYIFVDLGKDGVCDIVSIWVLHDKEEDLWSGAGVGNCEEAERNIKTQIKFKEELKTSNNQ